MMLVVVTISKPDLWRFLSSIRARIAGESDDREAYPSNAIWGRVLRCRRRAVSFVGSQGGERRSQHPGRRRQVICYDACRSGLVRTALKGGAPWYPLQISN